MAALAHVLEPPPLTVAPTPGPATLVALPGGELARRLAEAERLVANNLHEPALEQLELLWPDLRHEPELAFRHLLAEAWARMYVGGLARTAELIEQADALSRSPRFDAGARAEVIFHRGCLAFTRSDVAEATSLFTRALDTNERAPEPSRLLAARVHEWRSRCHQFQRNWDAARRDAERSLDLANELGDEPAQARALFQAALVAERQRQWLLARCYAEQSLDICTRRGDLLGQARTLNNLGGILFLLGDVEDAERNLVDAARTATEAGSAADTAQAISSLAQVYLRTGRPAQARERACAAAEMLADREDFLDELGNVQLVAARCFAAEHELDSALEWLDRAETSFRRFASPSLLAAVWVARGDVLRDKGDADAAAALYRRAAESLQDVHF